MPGEKGSDQNYDFCLQPEKHRQHQCHLMDRGQTEEIRSQSRQPAYVCRNCGARAGEAASLCNPEALPSA